MKSRSKRVLLVMAGVLVLGGLLAGSAMAKKAASFKVIRPVAAPDGCLEGARGQVDIRPVGPVEVMTVDVKGMPPKTRFALFVNQLPQEPYGISWYQGDIKTDKDGKGTGRFVGRFSGETFAVAPDSGPAPVVHDDGPYPDASTNPEFAPVHTFHLTLWFDSPKAARRAGCPDTVTPFNGEHRAGIKALSTRAFPDDRGPLREVGS